MIKRLAQKQENSEQIRRDVTGIGFRRSEITLKLAERLETIAINSGDERTVLNARKLALCGSPKNIYTGKDMHNSDGECFDGVGHLWACKLGYCQNCAALKAKAHRNRIRDTLKQLKQPIGMKWNFVTLTSPSLPVPLLDSFKANLRAWDLLRKQKWFKGNVWAGWKNLENTVSQATGLNHVHIHALMLSKFLYPSEVRASWQYCITKAYRDTSGLFLKFGTSGAVIDVRPITRKNSAGMESAILEVAKYTSKGSSWLALSDSDLLAMSQLEKLPRLFESFGKSYAIRLDTHTITDGKKLHTAKERKSQCLSTLRAKVNVSRSWRKMQIKNRYPFAELKTLDGKDFLPREPQPTEPQQTKLRLIKGNKKQ